MTTQNIATSAAGASTGGGNRVPQGRWEHLSEQEKQERRAKVESDIKIKFSLPSNACLQCGKVHSMDASGFCPNLGTGCTYCTNKRHTVDACFKNFNANKAVSPKYPANKFSYGKGLFASSTTGSRRGKSCCLAQQRERRSQRQIRPSRTPSLPSPRR